MADTYLDRLRNSLAGKIPEPQIEVEMVPLPEMLAALKQIPDIAWTAYAFSREPINGKFTNEQRLQLAQEATACGNQYAEEYISLYPGTIPQSIVAKLGLQYSEPETPTNSSRVLFAQYTEPNQIEVFVDCLNKANALIEKHNLAALLENLDSKQVLIAHEFFHYVEFTNKSSIFTQTERIQLWKVGPLVNNSPIACLSEIAAMAFAKRLTGLPYSPYLLDVLLVYGYNPQAACALYQEIMQVTGNILQPLA